MPLKIQLKVREWEPLTFLETILFDMDNTIMTIMYKKNEIQEYDAATYVKLFGHSALKVGLTRWSNNHNRFISTTDPT